MSRSAPPTAAESLGKSVVRVSCGERYIEWKVDAIKSLPALISAMYRKEWGQKGERPWSVSMPSVNRVVNLVDGRECRVYRVRPTKWIMRHDAVAPGSSMIEGPELTVEVIQ